MSNRKLYGKNLFRSRTTGPINIKAGPRDYVVKKGINKGQRITYDHPGYSRAQGDLYPGRRSSKIDRASLAAAAGLNFKNISTMWHERGDPRNKLIHDSIVQYSISTNPGGFYAMRDKLRKAGVVKVDPKALTILKATGLGVPFYLSWLRKVFPGQVKILSMNDMYLFLFDTIRPEYQGLLSAMQSRGDHSGVASAIESGDIAMKSDVKVKKEPDSKRGRFGTFYGY